MILLVTLVILFMTGTGRFGSVLITVVSVISNPSEKNSCSAFDMFLPGILFSGFTCTKVELSTFDIPHLEFTDCRVAQEKFRVQDSSTKWK